MTARERFEKWVKEMNPFDYSERGLASRVVSDTALDAWEESARQTMQIFWPPKPVNLPAGWRIKGEEPRMIMHDRPYPKHYSHKEDVYNGQFGCNTSGAPVFVWELERVEGCVAVKEYRYRILTGSIGLEGPWSKWMEGEPDTRYGNREYETRVVELERVVQP